MASFKGILWKDFTLKTNSHSERKNVFAKDVTTAIYYEDSISKVLNVRRRRYVANSSGRDTYWMFEEALKDDRTYKVVWGCSFFGNQLLMSGPPLPRHENPIWMTQFCSVRFIMCCGDYINLCVSLVCRSERTVTLILICATMVHV